LSIPRRVLPPLAALLTALLMLTGVAYADTYEPSFDLPPGYAVDDVTDAEVPAPTSPTFDPPPGYIVDDVTDADITSAQEIPDFVGNADEDGTHSGRSIRGAEGARLIALNMALNGTPRDETARYLSQNFDLDDQDALLDEVYARVGD
jgi:hypothetical protein